MGSINALSPELRKATPMDAYRNAVAGEAD
jgi:hypothetical protein